MAELFPSEQGFHHAEVLKLVKDPVKLNEYNKCIDHFVIGYIEIKTVLLNERSLREEFKFILDLKNKLNFNHATLSKLAYKEGFEVKLNKLTSEVYFSENIYFLHQLQHSNLTDEQSFSLKSKLETLTDITRKNALESISPDEKSFLDSYDEIYKSNLDILESVSENINEQSHILLLSNIENNQIIYFQSDDEVYIITSYSRNGKYFMTLSDSTGIELIISHSEFNQAKEHLSNIFNKYINQEIVQEDGTVSTRGRTAGFKYRAGEAMFGEAQVINTASEAYQTTRQTIMSELDKLFQTMEISIADDPKITFGEQVTSLKKLRDIGATIDGEPLNFKHIQHVNWEDSVKFNPDKLSFHLTFLTGDEENTKLVRMLNKSLQDDHIARRIDNNSSVHQSAILHEQLQLIQNSRLGNQEHVDKVVQDLQHIGVKLPVYAKMANYFGQGIGATGIFLTINSVYQLIDELDNPNLSEQERRDIQKNLDMACANAFFNYGDMVLQPILLKIAYKQAGSFNASSKITARITFIFNLIGMGLDVYQACEAFEQLEKAQNAKDRQDLLVNGSLSIANIVVGGVTMVGIIIGSSTIPVVGLIVAGVLLIGRMVYTGIRAVEKIEEELGESLDWDEQAKEGIRAAFGFSPSENILNRFSYKQHLAHFRNINWQQDLDTFKLSFLYQGFDEHLQLVGKPILIEHIKYYIYNINNSELISSIEFDDADKNTLLRNIDSDDTGPCYTIEQIDFIRSHYQYNSQDRRWIKNTKAQRINELNFNYRFRLANKNAPIAYRDIGEEIANDIIVLNPKYDSHLLNDFLSKKGLAKKYRVKKNQPIAAQLASLSASELRLFKARNNYTNITHPDINRDVAVNQLGDEFINQPIEIATELLSEKPGIIYEGMQNISYRYEKEAKQKNISFNSGNGTDIIIGKTESRNVFNINSGSKFLAGGECNDIMNLSLLTANLDEKTGEVYFDGGGGTNTLIIKDIPSESKVNINLDENISIVTFNDNKTKVLNLKNIHDVILTGSRTTEIKLFGNEENNTLDAGSTIAFIHGMEGNDQIIFESGLVNGGEGNDSYFLRRFDWNDVQDTLNDNLLELSAVIIENEQGQSRVNLGYSLKEIKNISISGNDLVLGLEVNSTELANKILKFNLTLKNIYRVHNGDRILNHRYQLYTRDGFILNSTLENLDANTPDIIKKDIFSITYQGKDDSVININESEKTISIDNNVYSAPLWGTFKFHGGVSKLKYKGDIGDNRLLMVSRNSEIMVTEGKDVYQISPEQFVQGRIVFNFSGIKSEANEKNEILILLPTEDGFNMRVSGTSVFLYDKLNNMKLEMSLINHQYAINKEIYIKDGCDNLFRLKIGQDEHNITPIKPWVLPTEKDDYIDIPKGYKLPTSILDMREGDDLVEDNSMKGNFIISGKGNDIITVAGGVNTLYGGEGDNYIYGGEKSDLILSDLGNDKLDGQGGDDHYWVDGNKGTGKTEIYDNIGKNKIHLINFQHQYEVISKDSNIYHRYTSMSGLRTVKIKILPNNEAHENRVYHHQQLPSHMPNYINGGMAHLVRYLAEQRQYKKELATEKVWHPLDEFKHFSNDSSFSSVFSSDEKKIHISKNAPFRRLFIHTKGQEQKIWDKSGVGRVFKAQAVTGVISIPDNIYGNNVLYAEKSDINLSGGEGNDVFISNGANGLLTDASGKNSFIVNGEVGGWNSLYSLGGENTIYLINFKHEYIREEPDHISNATRFIYTSEQGRMVNVFQYPNTIAPTIIHMRSLEGRDDHSTYQKLDHLVNTLAALRLQDEESAFGVQNIENIQANWNPVKLVDNYMKKAI